MASTDSISNEEKDKQFLASCEELLKDRYTEKDEEFMKVFNAEPSLPPILESWWVPNSGGRRNDRRFNRRCQAYSRDGPRGGDGADHGARYPDSSRNYGDRSYQQHSHRPRNY